MDMELEEVLKSVKRHRKFSSEPIREESLRRILKLAKKAPSPGGNLPLRLIILRDDEVKRRVAEACGKRRFFAEAPVVMVAVAIPDEAEPFMGGYANSFPLDAAAALTVITLAAGEEGLGTNWTLQFKDEKIKELLGIPEEMHVVGVSPLGYPEDEGERYSSSPADMVFYGEWEE